MTDSSATQADEPRSSRPAASPQHGVAQLIDEHQARAKQALDRHQASAGARLDNLTAKTAEAVDFLGERVKGLLPDSAAEAVNDVLGKARDLLVTDQSATPKR
ncbi:MAG: hypothetical protein AAGC63_04615 [Propionicimonas sp.]|nr:hypothetical protein [Propionicimonas sp.]